MGSASGLHDGPLIGGTEFAIEAGQCGLDEPWHEGHPCSLAIGIEFPRHSQAAACLSMLRQVWPDRILETLSEFQCQPVLAVVVGARSASEEIPACLALPAFLHGYVANLVNAGVRLIPLGQTDGQAAIAGLEPAVLRASQEGCRATLDNLGSAGFMVELSSIAHETQYTRLFRS